MGKRWSVAATVAVVVTLAAAISLARQDDITTSSTRPAAEPTAPVDLSGAIPWIDSSFSPEDYLKSLPTPSPTPPPPTDARPCTADDVTPAVGDENGAGGHTVRYLEFRNISASTCVLIGYPRVVAKAPGRPDVTATEGSFFSPSALPANTEPGESSVLGLESDTYCPARPGGGGGEPPYASVEIELPGGGTLTVDQPFDITCGLHLTPFFVPQPEIVPEPDPISSINVTLTVPASVVPGSALIYVAELTNPTDTSITLDPCPGYLVAPTKETHQLNCATVSAIAPHETVRFEMHTMVPTDTPTGPYKIGWILFGPNEVNASATVEVLPAPAPSSS